MEGCTFYFLFGTTDKKAIKYTILQIIISLKCIEINSLYYFIILLATNYENTNFIDLFIDFPLISNMSFLTYTVGKWGKSISSEREAKFLSPWKTQNKKSDEGIWHRGRGDKHFIKFMEPKKHRSSYLQIHTYKCLVVQMKHVPTHLTQHF